MAELPSVVPQDATEPDWTEQVTDLIVDVVDRVHDKTTGPILGVARAVVYGTVALFAGVVVIVLGMILFTHLLGLLPGEIWIAYMVLGALLVLGGLFMWTRRQALS